MMQFFIGERCWESEQNSNLLSLVIILLSVPGDAFR